VPTIKKFRISSTYGERGFISELKGDREVHGCRFEFQLGSSQSGPKDVIVGSGTGRFSGSGPPRHDQEKERTLRKELSLGRERSINRPERNEKAPRWEEWGPSKNRKKHLVMTNLEKNSKKS